MLAVDTAPNRPHLRLLRTPLTDLEARIERAVTEPDPVVSNRLVTESHHALGVALRDVIGDESGANFHSWAVWGSREAGRTIAERDLPGLVPAATITGVVLGALLGTVLAGPLGPVLGAVIGGVVAHRIVRRGLRRSSEEILTGNRIVLDDIGRATAVFVEAFASAERHDRDHFAVFASMLRPGRTEDGGQDLLRRAFACWYDARFEADPVRQHQLVFAGNCFAVWHEHIRLQRHIAAAMARPFQRWITKRLLDFQVGDEHLWVGRDVTGPYPITLAHLDEPEARAADTALRQPRVGSAAANWACLEDRMHYVVELFRTRHTAPGVFAPPY